MVFPYLLAEAIGILLKACSATKVSSGGYFTFAPKHSYLVESLLVTVAVLLRIISNPLANVFQKQLTVKGVHPLLINAITYVLLSIICIFPAVPVQWNELSKEFWFYSVLAGIAGAVGN